MCMFLVEMADADTGGSVAALEVASTTPAALEVASTTPAALEVASTTPAALELASTTPAALELASTTPAALEVASTTPAALDVALAAAQDQAVSHTWLPEVSVVKGATGWDDATWMPAAYRSLEFLEDAVARAEAEANIATQVARMQQWVDARPTDAPAEVVLQVQVADAVTVRITIERP